jgi:hypothetical protein
LSLRKKISEHKKKACHKKGETVQMSAKKKSLETGINKMNKDRFESTERIFRTAYKVAQMNRPFTDLPVDAEVHELNGLDMGRVLHSKFSCTNITDHIAQEMRKKIVQHLLDNNIKISVQQTRIGALLKMCHAL